MLCPALFARAQFRDYPTAPVCRFPVAGLSGFCPCVKSGRCRPWILCGGAVAPGVLCVRFSLCRCGSLIGREKGRGCGRRYRAAVCCIRFPLLCVLPVKDSSGSGLWIFCRGCLYWILPAFAAGGCCLGSHAALISIFYLQIQKPEHFPFYGSLCSGFFMI